MDNKNVSKREYGAITDKYIGVFEPLSESKRLRSRPASRQLVLYGDEKYYLYRYDGMPGFFSCEFLLMPKKIDFEKGICSDILHITVFRDAYNFKRISFNDDDTYTSTNYNLSYTYDAYRDQFDLNKDVYTYSYDKEKFNEELKRYRYNELFFMRNLNPNSSYSKLLSRTLVKVVRDDYITKYKIVDMNDLSNAFSRLMDEDDFSIIDDNESTMLDIADSFEIDKEKINLK